MAIKIKHWRLSFRVTVVSTFLFMTLATAVVGMALQYYFSTGLATKSTLSLYRQAAAQTGDYLGSLDKSVTQTLKMLAPRTGLTGRTSTRPPCVAFSFRSFARIHCWTRRMSDFPTEISMNWSI